MDDLSGRVPKKKVRIIVFSFLIAVLIALVVVLIVFAGGSSYDVDTPVYKDGKLVTTISNSGNDEMVWVQYRIFRQDGLKSEQIGDTFSYGVDLKKGKTVTTCDVNLDPGKYKIFIYLSTYVEDSQRIAGFVRDIEVK